MSLFAHRKVAAAVITEEDFQAALASKVDIIFLLYSDLLTIESQIAKAQAAGKKLLCQRRHGYAADADQMCMHTGLYERFQIRYTHTNT